MPVDSYDFCVRRVVSAEPIFVVSDVARAVAHYERLGFSTSHHDPGYAFAHRNDLTATEVGQALGLDPGYLSRLLKGFEQKGLVERNSSSADGRQSHLRLTAAGPS